MFGGAFGKLFPIRNTKGEGVETQRRVIFVVPRRE